MRYAEITGREGNWSAAVCLLFPENTLAATFLYLGI